MPSAPRSTRRRPKAVLIAATAAAALFLAPAANAGVLSDLLGNPVGTVNSWSAAWPPPPASTR